MAFWIFWTHWVLKSKKSNIPLQKKFNDEKWSFYHNLSSPNSKIEEISVRVSLLTTMSIDAQITNAEALMLLKKLHGMCLVTFYHLSPK